MSRIWKLDFRLWTEAKDSPQPIRDCLVRVSGSELEWPLDRQGRSTRSGLKCLNMRFSALWGVNEPTKWLHRFENDRSIRGASQQQQPHKSNSSGRVKPLTPLLARRKRMPSLDPSPIFGSQPGCQAREFTLHKAMPHRQCFDHHHKTLLLNRSLDQLPLRHATQAIHSMRLISINI